MLHANLTKPRSAWPEVARRPWKWRLTTSLRLMMLVIFLTLCPHGLDAEPGPSKPQKLAFVTNSSGASISLINVDMLAEVRRVAVLREPHRMALTPYQKFLLIGDTVGNELPFFDPFMGDLVRRKTIPYFYPFGFSPDENGSKSMVWRAIKSTSAILLLSYGRTVCPPAQCKPPELFNGFRHSA